MECLREQRRIHKAPDFLLFFCYPTYYPQDISSTSLYPHHPSRPLVFSTCWPWLILHPILLSSLPTQYTLATTSGFGLAHMNQAAFIFHVIFHHLRTSACLLHCSSWIWVNTRPTGWMIAFSFLLNSRALLISHGLSLPPLSASPQRKMLSSHISGTAFVEKSTEEGTKPAADCRRSQCCSEDKGL